jgi:hypothetical protein
MTYESFLFIHDKLSAGIAKAVDDGRRYKQLGGRGGNYKPPPVRNGPVSSCVWLACTLGYFAGGLPYDIMAKYGISHAAVLESIWAVVEAMNSYDEFIIEYPASKTAQLKIAHEFQNVSKVQFSNCTGAIDGILIWILKPSEADANNAGCGQRNLFVVARENLG